MKPIKTNKPGPEYYRPAQGFYNHFFPTTIFNGRVNLNHEEVRQHIDHVTAKIPKTIENIDGDHLHRGNDYTTYFFQELKDETHNQPWFTSFANQMKDSYVEYLRSQFHLDLTGLKRSDIHFFAWVNKYSTKHSHSVHDHVRSRLSGTYYLTCENAQPITFINPANVAVFNNDVLNNDHLAEEDSQFIINGAGSSQMEVKFMPKEGDFLLWPSYLLHYVHPSDEYENDNYQRYSISFNLAHNMSLDNKEHGDELDYSFLMENNDV
tara:strand:+ start:1744 stop:2538 length:795 start_codon:yes stop_codon:yes gene_type:complete